MSSTNHTPNLNLSQFIPLDKPAWLGDYNSDMSKIDTAVHKVQTQADSMETAVEQATTAAQAATQAAQAATEAAQDAADKAQDAETTANNVSGSATQALTIAQQAQEAVTGKVDKAGDTMTGALAFNFANVNGEIRQIPQSASLDQLEVHSDGVLLLRSTGQITIKPNENTGTSVGMYFASDASHKNKTALIANSGYITNLSDPIEDQDAATKAYVDANGGGTSPNNNVFRKVSSTMTKIVTLNGGLAFVTSNFAYGQGYLLCNAALNVNDSIFMVQIPTGKTFNTSMSAVYLSGVASGNFVVRPLKMVVDDRLVTFVVDGENIPAGTYLITGLAFTN